MATPTPSQPPFPTFASVNVLGVDIHQVGFADLLAQIEAWVERPEGGRVRQICTVNPEFVMLARRDSDFATALAGADLRVPDGVGVLLASWLQGEPLHERVTGSDGIYRIAQRAAQKGWRIFLLGAGPGVAQRTGAELTRRYPGLTICGTYAGAPQAAEWPEIQRRLVAARPHILFVAYGHPQQDLWIHRHRQELPGAVAMGVGGAFDFVAGITRRAPIWMQRLGLEWLHRLLQQPWRWRRMTAIPRFTLLALRQRVGLLKH